MHGRTLTGQTGTIPVIPPISSVQPQQCHLVRSPHITHFRTNLNGSSTGSSWCFESGRMRFDLSSIVTFDHNSFAKKKYQTPAFFCMRLGCLVVMHGTLSPYFNRRQTSFPHGIFLVGTVLLGLAIQDMILPRYVCFTIAYTTRKNHILKGKPEKHRAYKKYSVREARLALIEIWACHASLHPNLMHKNLGVWYFLFVKLL